ncbi:hypothetical protein B0E37_01720 [Streptomyces sp. MH192]|nr:hypothetical protein [Streptomyces sp. MH192]MCF0098817.1 hypothetical protein [Streptomyces sp. MH191]
MNRTQLRPLAGHAAYGLLGISIGAAATWCSLHYWPGPDVPLGVTGVVSLLLSVAAVTVLSGIHARLTRPRARRARPGRRAHARPRPRAARKAP